VKMSFMAGIAASFLAARSVLNNGFLTQLICSITSKGKAVAGPKAAGAVRGLATGFAAASLLSFTGIGLIVLIAGYTLFFGGMIMMALEAVGAVNMGKGGGN